MTGRKRGRPKSQVRIEQEKTEELLRNRPCHIAPMTDERTKELEESFRQSERVRQEILRGYKHGPTTPDNHAYEMASLGDESMMGHEARILENDKRFAKRQSVYRVRGAESTKEKAEDRAQLLVQKNRVLIGLISTTQTYTINKVAGLIEHQWEAMSPGNILKGEPPDMDKRGIGGPRPSLKTIERWIKKTGN